MVVRTTELKKLENIYREGKNSLTLIYGSAVSGKEDLLRLFLKDKTCFYFRCRDVSPEAEKALFLREIGGGPSAETVAEGFSHLKGAFGAPLVVCIDDFQYIARHGEEFLSAILSLKAGELCPGPVMILVLSTALSWTRKWLSTPSPFLKGLDGEIFLADVPFLDLVRAFPSYPVSDAIKVYGILGGAPDFLCYFTDKSSVRENVIKTILSPEGGLYHAMEDFLQGELRELSVYETILASMARGKEKLNDLFLDTGYSRAKISVYLKNLAAFDVVERTVSFETGGWDKAKKGIYRIRDHFLRFWFTFLYPHLSDLFLLGPEKFYDTYIGPGLEEYLRPAFVQVCREYLLLLDKVGKTPIHLKKVGTWIGKEGTIDIVGQNEIRENIVGLCSLGKAGFPYSSYEDLLSNMELARIKAKAIYLFSATDFDIKLRALAFKDPSVILVDMKEL